MGKKDFDAQLDFIIVILFFFSDPGFTFQGAGSSVFGSKGPLANANKSKSLNVSNKSKDGDEDDDNVNDNENGDEHDPHFEPIVPLPDAIEVRTGEEDETKGRNTQINF